MFRKNKKRKKSSSQLNYSSLEQHRQSNKQLIPPFLQIPNLQMRSWKDERLPEMLWAVLLIGNLERDHALEVFREVARYVAKFGQTDSLLDITHTGIAAAQEDVRKGLINIMAYGPKQREVLTSLVLFENLPARASWQQVLEVETDKINTAPLMNAVAKTLDHQSQESTDCRWMRIIAAIAADRFHLPSEEMMKEFNNYPEYGDMRKVRPSIRASEGSLASFDEVKSKWSEQFWEECWRKTGCFPLQFPISENACTIGTTEDQLRRVYITLIQHFLSSTTTTAIDVQHDLVFGTAFYCLSILRELLSVGIAKSILARSGLRTLLECYITLRYLVMKNQLELWKSYRVYGSGQAKLAFLKLESDPEKPSSINLETLNTLANDDLWQEFLPINLGHWENSNLRKMSVEADVKEDYDRFYTWTSAYSHGHWGPVREAVLSICGNPLHRLHRIPMKEAIQLPDVVSDACNLMDKILDLLDKCYPNFQLRIGISSSSSDTTVANDV